MWLPNHITEAVDNVARIYYIDSTMTARWNATRKPSELRLLTGWCWESKSGGNRDRDFYQGFKTRTVAYRDAWYNLVARHATPRYSRIRLVRSA